MEGYHRWFQFGAIMNKAAMYVHAQVLCGHGFISWVNAQECRSGSYDTCMFNFLGDYQTFLKVRVVPFAFPPAVTEFLCMLASIWWCHFFYFDRSDQCVMISHCAFNLHFLNG